MDYQGIGRGIGPLVAPKQLELDLKLESVVPGIEFAVPCGLIVADNGIGFPNLENSHL